MKLAVFLISAFSSVLLFGCANPINMYTAQRYFDAGFTAERTGDYLAAHENYYRAYVNTEVGYADDQRKALVMYNLARMKGYLCMQPAAEALFLNSVAVEEKALSQNGVWYTGRLVETARFYYGFGEYAKAIPYFEKGTARLASAGVEASNPIEMARIWDEYAESLRRVGSVDKANELAAKSQALLTGNAGKTARVPLFPYGRNCKDGAGSETGAR